MRHWRLAAADDIVENVGDNTAERTFALSRAAGGAIALSSFASWARGRSRRNGFGTITTTVESRASRPRRRKRDGLGLRSSRAREVAHDGGDGQGSFSLEPIPLASVTFRVSKSGFAAKYLYKKIRSS